MKKRILKLMSAMLCVIALGIGLAGEAQAESIFAPPQLDQMLAPIALYPDPLVAQILVAATYPLEIAEAARWMQEAGNGGLRGDALENALAVQDWDPSIKSLVPFQQILRLMNSQQSWTQQLGDAFLAQQEDVMAAIQRLRARAQAAGKLYTTHQEIVGSDGTSITIVPNDMQQVYIPAYDPAIVYGGWPYSDYPPYYFGGANGYPGIVFGSGVIVVDRLWGWGRCDWRQRRVHVDSARFNAINRVVGSRSNRPPLATPIWQHDSYHRRGIAYRDAATRERFAPQAAGTPVSSQAFRGYEFAKPAAPAALGQDRDTFLKHGGLMGGERPAAAPGLLPPQLPSVRPLGEPVRLPAPVVPRWQGELSAPGKRGAGESPSAREREHGGHERHQEAEHDHKRRQSFQLSPGMPASTFGFRPPPRVAPNSGENRR